MQKELYSVIRKIKLWIKKHNVLDVILFGSAVREKLRPNDIDLCIIIGGKDEKKSIDLVDSLGRLTDSFKAKFHINILVSNSFASGNNLAKTLILEGYSIKHNKNFSDILGFQAKSLFTYTLKHFSSSKRVKFHYLLRGRYGSKGILSEVKGKYIGTGSILIPTEKEDLLKEIFDKWRVRYDIYRVMFS